MFEQIVGCKYYVTMKKITDLILENRRTDYTVTI